MNPAAYDQVKQQLKDLFDADEVRKASRRAGRTPPARPIAPAAVAAQGTQDSTHEQGECPSDEFRAAAGAVQKRRARVMTRRCICFDIDRPMPKTDHQVLDSIWFRVNPMRHLRMRRAMPGEFELDQRGQRLWVIVRQLGPGHRMRLPFALVGDESLLTGLPDADAVYDLLLRELSKLPDGGEGVLIDILRRAPFDRAPASDTGEV